MHSKIDRGGEKRKGTVAGLSTLQDRISELALRNDEVESC
jgi:hypothetical protein